MQPASFFAAGPGVGCLPVLLVLGFACAGTTVDPGMERAKKVDAAYAAIRKGELGTVKRIFEDGFPLERSYTAEGSTPLFWAVRYEQKAVALYLLGRGANPDVHGPLGSPLSWCRDLELARALLAKGADPNRVTYKGRIAMFDLTGDQHRALLLLHLAHGARVDWQDIEGRTALHNAAIESDFSAAELLLARKAPVAQKDRHGNTALMYASASIRGSYGQKIKMLRRLVRAGSSIDERNNLDQTALMFALGAFGKEKAYRTLLRLGASPKAVDVNGWTALMFAALRGNVAAARDLLRVGVPVNARDRQGRTALTIARAADHGDVVRLLENAGGTQ